MKVYLDRQGITAKHQKNLKRTQLVLDQQIAKDSNFYIPKDKGDLERSVYPSAAQGIGRLEWAVDYARKMYHASDNRISKDRNPNARGKWFEEAKAVRKEEWERIANNEYRK